MSKYYVCIENELEDWFSSIAPSKAFDSFEEAMRYIDVALREDAESVFSAQDLTVYFPSCQSDGKLHNPDPMIDRLQCLQRINVIVSETYTFIDECYCDDERAEYSECRAYMIDFQSNVVWLT